MTISCVDEIPIFVVDGSPLNQVLAGDQVFQKNKPALAFSAKYGSIGSGNDGLRCPRGCAIDAKDIWIADTVNNRIMHRLRAGLTYVDQFGASGAADYQFQNVTGIEVDSKYLYDTDIILNRVCQRKKSDYSFIKKLDSTIAAAKNWKLGLNQPYDVAADDLYVYIADCIYFRILKVLKSDFSFVAEWGYCSQTIQKPQGIAVDASNVYFTNTQLNNVQQMALPPLWTPIARSGHPVCAGQGAFYYATPDQITLDTTYLYITDNQGRVIKRLKSDFSFVAQIYTPSPAGPTWVKGSLKKPTSLAVELDSSALYVVDPPTSMISRFDLALNFVSWSGDPTNYISIYKVENGTFTTDTEWVKGASWSIAGGVAVKAATSLDNLSQNTQQQAGRRYQITYTINSISGGTLTVQIGSTLGTARNAPGTYTEIILAAGTGDLTFVPSVLGVACQIDNVIAYAIAGNDDYEMPQGIAIDSDYVYVGDNGVFIRITKRNKDGFAFVALYEDAYINIGQVDALAVDDTYLYVADSSNGGFHRINKATMAYLDFHTAAGLGPTGICVVGNNIYLANWNNSSLDVWDKTNLGAGATSSTTAGLVWGNYILNSPTGIDVDETYAYIVDSNVFGISTYVRIVKINKTTGAFVAEQYFYLLGGVSTAFVKPMHIAVDCSYVYITEMASFMVIILNKTDLSFVFSKGGYGNDGVDLYRLPWGIDTYRALGKSGDTPLPSVGTSPCACDCATYLEAMPYF